jgi:hypothetical protein
MFIPPFAAARLIPWRLIAVGGAFVVLAGIAGVQTLRLAWCHGERAEEQNQQLREDRRLADIATRRTKEKTDVYVRSTKRAQVAASRDADLLNRANSQLVQLQQRLDEDSATDPASDPAGCDAGKRAELAGMVKEGGRLSYEAGGLLAEGKRLAAQLAAEREALRKD